MFSSLAVYHCFFTKIYDFRSRELLNMRSVPFAAKFLPTLAVSYYMCYRMWEDYIYDPELYKLALKHRHAFDPSLKDRLAISAYEEAS